MALINVFIPVFNAEPYLALTIESVLAQTYTNWELIIIDDYSTDNSYNVALAYSKKDPRISLIKNEQNLGMMRNWNKGISMCDAEYFAKLDADDLWHPNMLEESINIMRQQPDVGMVCTACLYINSKGDIVGESHPDVPDFARNKAFSCIDLVRQGSDKMLQYNILRQGVSLIRRKIFDEIGVYRTLLTQITEASIDTEMYFRIGCHHLIYCINKAYYSYRIHPTSISALDDRLGLSAQKLYEVKSVIIDYYFQQGKITSYEKTSSHNATIFWYNSFLIYKSRITGRYLAMFKRLADNFIIDPKRTLVDNIHIDRLLKWKRSTI
jgi:glycosyltransferase involved in cell wall biosynthesis